jgi:transglutaminase-like putative cysteine protease
VTATDPRSQIAAATVFLAAALLVAVHAPPWTIAIASACAIWRILVASGRMPAPRPRTGMRFVFGAITALLVGGVLLSFRTLNGLAAGTALLVLMGALKLLESRARRDDGIVIGVSLFLLLAAALAGQSLAKLPVYLLLLWGAGAAIAMVANSSQVLPLPAALRLSARTLAMAIPLAVACFLLFPRPGGHFWALPGRGAAQTGLSDEMSPGMIDKLVVDYEPAFRVDFEGPPPPPEERYWRGPVLNTFDGFTWRRARRVGYRGEARQPVGEAVRYRITMEPTGRNWLFSLDTIDRSPLREVLLLHDRQLWRPEPVNDTLSYDASSHLRTVTSQPLSGLGRQIETALPESANPRARELARRLRQSAADDAAYADMVLEWFRTQGLEYTFEPEPTSVDSVDSVLFDTRRGFCGHFASAYATLMRAVGIPARVVTGYLGGEWNPVGSYLIVRQSDAHAWTEIWLDGRGWTRVDPTAVVAPGRLRAGVYELVESEMTPGAVAIWRTPWVSALSRYWDGANYWWRKRVVEFNERAQLDFLRHLGFDSPSWRVLGWLFAGMLLLWLAWVTLTLRRSVPRAKPDRLGRAWLRATRKLERVAPPREPAEGALTYARRVAGLRPDLATAVLSIAARYTEMRFGPRGADPGEIAALEREVRRLAA